MILIYVSILLFSLWGLRLRRPSDPSAALSVEQSTMIKGVFVLLVFASHVSQYLDLPGGLMTKSFQLICNNLGQLIVVPFLFFSGYGVRCSIVRKGDEYIRSLPKKRILRTYLHVALILLFFLTVQLIFGRQYSFKRIVFSFLLLDSFGNSNWYLFAILFLYIATWLSFRLVHSPKWACLLVFVFSIAYFIVISIWKESWWYDTVFVYGFGLVFPDLKDSFTKLTARNPGRLAVFAILIVAVLLLTMLHLHGLFNGLMENVRAVCFILLILVLLSWFEFGNPVFHWLGAHVFLCYFLQRLPMIVLDHIGVSKSSIPLFVLGSAVGTVILVLLFDVLLKRIDRHILQA